MVNDPQDVGTNGAAETAGDDAGRAACEHLAMALAAEFVERLGADGGDGAHSMTDIRAALAEFQGDDEARAEFRVLLAACLERRDDEVWDQAGRRPFDRVLVRRFAHLLPPEEAPGDVDWVLSRRLLPAFFFAFEMMAGPEFFTRCQLTCKGILASKRQKAQSGEPWKILYRQLYDDDDANDLVNDLLFAVAPHFAEFDKRLEWLRGVINSHLAPAEDYDSEGSRGNDWRLTRADLLALLGALFADIETKLGDDAGLRHLLSRYGVRDCATMGTLIEALQATE
jgi:hypothetical protein